MRFHHHSGLVLAASLAAGAASATTASADYVTSFEQPDYVPGGILYVESQDDWDTSGISTARVQTADQLADELVAAGLNAGQTVHSGNQALIATGGTTNIRPIDGLAGAHQVIADLWFRPLTPGADGSTIGQNVGNTFVMFEDTTGSGGRAAGFRLDDENNSIDVFATGTAGPGWYQTGQSWEADTWYNIRFELDYSTQTFQVSLDGTSLFPPGTAAGFNSSSDYLHQLRVFTGGGQAGAIFDDVSITTVPEPATVGLMLAAGGAMLLRRGERA